MIIINDKKYDNVLKKVSFGEYSVMQDGKKRNGMAPFISFNCDNILLGIETNYDNLFDFCAVIKQKAIILHPIFINLLFFY